MVLGLGASSCNNSDKEMALPEKPDYTRAETWYKSPVVTKEDEADIFYITPTCIWDWEDEEGRTKAYVLHAEANAITKVAKSNNSSEGSTLYVTASPCIECAKLIIQAGIKRVVYSEPYRSADGLALLREAGVAVELIGLEGLND